MAANKFAVISSTHVPPTPPLTYFWSPPDHGGLLDVDVEETVRDVPLEALDALLWDTHNYFQAMLKYVRNCLACRASAKRMNLPHGSKGDWWNFVYEADTYLSRIESRLMFVLDEMTRRHLPSEKKNKRKEVPFKENGVKENTVKSSPTSPPPSPPPLVKETATKTTPPSTPPVTPSRPLKKRRLLE
jgi:hypothetical protein